VRRIAGRVRGRFRVGPTARSDAPGQFVVIVIVVFRERGG